MKIRIKNSKKFIRSILVVLGIIGFFSLILANKTFSHGPTNYRIYGVSNGDSMWQIARQEQNTNPYFEGKDVREIISTIKRTNNLTSSDLAINQELKIPTI